MGEICPLPPNTACSGCLESLAAPVVEFKLITICQILLRKEWKEIKKPEPIENISDISTL